TNPQTATQLLTKTAQTVATKNPKIISPTSLATQAVAHMETHSITRLWVVENGKPLGLLRLQDCLTAGVI
ncbi:MAG: CBS domain-containing protein, partial [Proteobacteria bacterium]|nr:CBS domain-containing protein [Pseudomonadota bacterium]